MDNRALQDAYIKGYDAWDSAKGRDTYSAEGTSLPHLAGLAEVARQAVAEGRE